MEPEYFNQFSDIIIPKLMTPSFISAFHHIDWKVIASIDLEELVHSYDSNILNKILPYIVFCNIANEFTERIDPIFLKLYRLAQIIIEYFIHSQHQFTEHFSSVQKEYDQLKTKYQMLITELEEKKQLHNLMRTKLQSQRRTYRKLQSDKSIVDNHTLFLCNHCGKQFYTQAFLSTHIEKRHHGLSNKNIFTRESPHIPCDMPLNLAIESPNEDLTRFSRNEQNLFRYISERILKQVEQGLQKRLFEQENAKRDHLKNIKRDSEGNESKFNLINESLLTEIKEQDTKNGFENFQDLINDIRLSNMRY